MSDLVNLKMLKELKRLHKKSGSESDGNGMDGKSKGFKKLHQLRKRLAKRPLVVCRRFRTRVKEQLSITDPRQPWKYTDFAKKHRATFGKMKGLWRVFHLLCEILDALDPGNVREVDWATALTVQSLKALLQVAYDKAAWTTAALLLPVPDPMGRSEFGGDESELEAIYDYRKAVTSLKKQREGTEQAEEGESPKEGSEADGQKKKKGGKNVPKKE